MQIPTICAKAISVGSSLNTLATWSWCAATRAQSHEVEQSAQKPTAAEASETSAWVCFRLGGIIHVVISACVREVSSLRRSAGYNRRTWRAKAETAPVS